jgi:hypothetical protein
MKFTPIPVDELKSSFLLMEGKYDFEVMSANSKISKSGNDMIELTLKLFGYDGKTHTIFDYLLSTESTLFKLYSFCEATEILDKYNSGDLVAHDCISLCGKAEIGIRRGVISPQGDEYPPKNIVKKYVKSEKQKDNEADEDLPF